MGLFFDLELVIAMPSIEIAGRIALVDQEDLHFFEGVTWTIRVSGSTAYVQRCIHQDGKYVGFELLHRLISGCPEGKVVDHINGNGLDNRKANLRVCSHAENIRNRRMHLNNRSGFKGVYFDDTSRGKPWRAQITFCGKKYRLGRFDTPEAASAAYQEAASRMHGEFARAA